MRLWLMKPLDSLDWSERSCRETHTNPWIPWYDKPFGYVIGAGSESEARCIADEYSRSVFSGCVSPRPWVDPKLSSRVELAGDDIIRGVILEDLRRA